jgi:hypothetical protein
MAALVMDNSTHNIIPQSARYQIGDEFNLVRVESVVKHRHPLCRPWQRSAEEKSMTLGLN